jgi:peptidoglycan hydrolase-like protein with peptidoglycan-binding domain
MTPHPPHHIPVPRRTVRRAVALCAALLVIVGTPLVARALDDAAPEVAGDLEPSSAEEATIEVSDSTASLGDATAAAPEQSASSLDGAATVMPGAVAERMVDPVVAVLTDTYLWNEDGPRIVMLQQALGVVVDGRYGYNTHEAHRAMLEAFGLPTDTVPIPPTPTPPPGTTAAQWAALRECESNSNYSITNPSGKYRGAYQFDRPTWDSVAVHHAPHLVGVDPAAASPADQDAMAFALYSDRGASPWPQCGRHLR